MFKYSLNPRQMSRKILNPFKSGVKALLSMSSAAGPWNELRITMNGNLFETGAIREELDSRASCSGV
jgi:hypothetical protein